MSPTDDFDLSGLSMLELFRLELSGQTAALTQGLLAIEREPSAAVAELGAMMRAAHSLKGAARIVGRELPVRVIHAMESRFTAAMSGEAPLARADVDAQLAALDLLGKSANVSDAEVAAWEAEHAAEITALLARLSPSPSAPSAPTNVDHAAPPAIAPEPSVSEAVSRAEQDRSLRLAPESLDRLFGFAGESLVAARWVETFAANLVRLKWAHDDLWRRLDDLRDELGEHRHEDAPKLLMADLHGRAGSCRDAFASAMAELDVFSRGFSSLSVRLHQEVVDCRMRPLGDRLRGFPRMVRDLARQLGKEVKLEITGEATPVDREILERIEAPLGHLLRNALDHGIESPGARARAGKNAEGVVHLDARHAGGLLVVTVSDDGAGIALDDLRRSIVEKGLSREPLVAAMSEVELYAFLFLPRFTMREHVTDVSGRGVGLDVVHSMVRALGGSVSLSSRAGTGTQCRLELPVTVSMVRALVVEVAGEPYAFALARIANASRLEKGRVETIEGRQYFHFRGERVGLVTAHQVLARHGAPPAADLAVVIVGVAGRRHGVVVDRFLGERQLLVRPLDPRLGKVENVSAAAILPDRTPVLILDVEDIVRSIDKLASASQLVPMSPTSPTSREGELDGGRRAKRVLVIDDSLTIRELQRKLLESRGYSVDVAIDGMDGWNAVRSRRYDLVVTDVDMPRLDGIELVTLIRKDPKLASLPIMVVSYKDRPEDRRRGLDAGADYYLAKSEFQEDALLRVVAEMIGEAVE